MSSLSEGWSKAAGTGRAGCAGALLGFLQTLGEGGRRRPASCCQIGSPGMCLGFPLCKVGGGMLEAALG